MSQAAAGALGVKASRAPPGRLPGFADTRPYTTKTARTPRPGRRAPPHLRAHKEPLEQHPQRLAGHASRVDPNPRRREPRRDGADQVGAAGDVAAAGRERAAAVFDEGSHGEVCADGRRLAGLCELSVAVVDDDDAVGVLGGGRVCVIERVKQA